MKSFSILKESVQAQFSLGKSDRSHQVMMTWSNSSCLMKGKNDERSGKECFWGNMKVQRKQLLDLFNLITCINLDNVSWKLKPLVLFNIQDFWNIKLSNNNKIIKLLIIIIIMAPPAEGHTTDMCWSQNFIHISIHPLINWPPTCVRDCARNSGHWNRRGFALSGSWSRGADIDSRSVGPWLTFSL